MLYLNENAKEFREQNGITKSRLQYRNCKNCHYTLGMTKIQYSQANELISTKKE